MHKNEVEAPQLSRGAACIMPLRHFRSQPILGYTLAAPMETKYRAFKSVEGLVA